MLFCFSFSSVSLPNPLSHLPRLFRFHLIPFHPPPCALLWETRMQWGRWRVFFFPWDFPPTPSIFPKLGVYCCWPFKGNYDRIMLRGQLWRKNGNTWMVSLMLASKSQWKVRNPQLKPPSITKSGMLFCPGNYSGSMSAVLPVCLIRIWNGQVVYNTVRRICGGCKNDLCGTKHMAWKCNFSDSEWILLLKYYKAEISALLIW